MMRNAYQSVSFLDDDLVRGMRESSVKAAVMNDYEKDMWLNLSWLYVVCTILTSDFYSVTVKVAFVL